MAQVEVDLSLVHMGREWFLYCLEHTLEIYIIPVRIFFVDVWSRIPDGSLAHGFHLYKAILVQYRSVCMAGYEMRVGKQRDFAVLHFHHGRSAYRARQGNHLFYSVRITLVTRPVSPQPSHLPESALPLVVDEMAFVEDVQDLYRKLLRGLHIRVVRLPASLHPQIGTQGTPRDIGHLAWMDDVLVPGSRPGMVFQHESLYVSQEERSFRGVGIIRQIPCKGNPSFTYIWHGRPSRLRSLRMFSRCLGSVPPHIP